MFASVLHFDQIQSVGGRSSSGHSALTRVEDAAQIFQAHRSLPHQQECADQVPHHVMKKPVAADSIDKFFAFGCPTGSEDCSNVCRVNVSRVNILTRSH